MEQMIGKRDNLHKMDQEGATNDETQSKKLKTIEQEVIKARKEDYNPLKYKIKKTIG
jgi:hypothetical protein